LSSKNEITVLVQCESPSTETFFLNPSGVLNAILEDSQGLGTILKDD